MVADVVLAARDVGLPEGDRGRRNEEGGEHEDPVPAYDVHLISTAIARLSSRGKLSQVGGGVVGVALAAAGLLALPLAIVWTVLGCGVVAAAASGRTAA